MDREKLRENRYTSSWYTLWLVNATAYFNTYVSHLVSRAQSLANISSMRIPTTPHFLTFKELFFMKCGGGGGGVVAQIEVFEKMLTGSPLLSFRRFSLVRFFTARFFRSAALTESLAQATL